MLVKIKNKLKEVTINYAYLLGDWVNLFHKDFLGGFYMNNLMSFLYIMYQEETSVMRPKQKYVFQSFLNCRYVDVKVILITEFPSVSKRGNNVGLGNNELASREFVITPQLSTMKTCIEETIYHGLSVEFDNSLAEWGDQGVFTINSALTCTEDDYKKHKEYWKLFIKQLLEDLSNTNTNLIFAFIGEACEFAQYVNNDFNIIVKEELSIEGCLKKKEIWMSDIFNKINDEIYNLTGDRNVMIDW